jgi:hypothetical protein
MLATIALTAALATFNHSAVVQTDVQLLCTAQRPCGCPWSIQICVPVCHVEPYLECMPT